MAIVKEYFCLGHGSFESDRPTCPHGCSAVEREFRTAPAYHDGTNRKVDNLVRSQVDAMGLGNIKTNLREGDTARIHSPAASQALAHQAAIRKRFPSNWGAVPKAGTFRAGAGPEGEVAGGGAVASFSGMKTKSAAEVEAQTGMRMNENFAKPVQGSKPAYEAVQDKQGLKLDISKAA